MPLWLFVYKHLFIFHLGGGYCFVFFVIEERDNIISLKLYKFL